MLEAFAMLIFISDSKGRRTLPLAIVFISMEHMNHLESQGPFGHPVCDVQMLEAVAMLFFIHDCKGRCTLPLATVLMSTERMKTIE